MSTTSDRNDPRLTRGTDTEPVDQAEAYLVLTDEERARGFVRPQGRCLMAGHDMNMPFEPSPRTEMPDAQQLLPRT